MSKDNRQIRLGAFIMATGHHIAAWRHPDAQADAGHNIDHYRELAKTAERGKFDLVFVADSPAGWEGSRPAILERVSHGTHFVLRCGRALSQVTDNRLRRHRITTYEIPICCRKFRRSTISGGRAVERGDDGGDVAHSIAGTWRIQPYGGRASSTWCRSLGSARGRRLHP